MHSPCALHQPTSWVGDTKHEGKPQKNGTFYCSLPRSGFLQPRFTTNAPGLDINLWRHMRCWGNMNKIPIIRLAWDNLKNSVCLRWESWWIDVIRQHVFWKSLHMPVVIVFPLENAFIFICNIMSTKFFWETTMASIFILHRLICW